MWFIPCWDNWLRIISLTTLMENNGHNSHNSHIIVIIPYSSTGVPFYQFEFLAAYGILLS